MTNTANDLPLVLAVARAGTLARLSDLVAPLAPPSEAPVRAEEPAPLYELPLFAQMDP